MNPLRRISLYTGAAIGPGNGCEEGAVTLPWRHVQELGFVLNYVSVEQQLPTVFMPVSPPPYLNGGVEFLSWVVESKDPSFTPDQCAEWLEGRLPCPVDDAEKWKMDAEHEG
jgi:hypothetical protein